MDAVDISGLNGTMAQTLVPPALDALHPLQSLFFLETSIKVWWFAWLLTCCKKTGVEFQLPECYRALITRYLILNALSSPRSVEECKFLVQGVCADCFFPPFIGWFIFIIYAIFYQFIQFYYLFHLLSFIPWDKLIVFKKSSTNTPAIIYSRQAMLLTVPDEHDVDSFIHLIAQVSSTHGDTSIETLMDFHEVCPICFLSISFTNLDTACCTKGHQWQRSANLFSIQSHPWSFKCVLCDRSQSGDPQHGCVYCGMRLWKPFPRLEVAG